jgi:hypothetical protein
MGTSADVLSVNMTEVSRQAVSTNAVDIGDSFNFQIVIDLPAIDAINSTDLTAEFFATSPLTGKALRILLKSCL